MIRLILSAYKGRPTSQYLVFRLHGPMASWGMDAPGEIRYSHGLSSRSALLGLLAVALGIRREEERRLNAFNQHYSFLLCVSSEPRWAGGHHIIQMPKEVRKACCFSRREELQDPELFSTLIPRRDYYTDVWWAIVVAVMPDAPYTLEQLHEALRYLVFLLYLGRKNRPPMLSLMPLLPEGHAAEVLRQAYRQYQAEFSLLRLSPRQLQDQCWWEGGHAGLATNKILRHRDCPLNRQQCLFGERTVNQGARLSKEETCTS